MAATTRARKVTDLPSDIPSASLPSDGPTPFDSNGGMPRITPDDVRDAAPDLPKSKADTELILKSLLGTYVGIGTVLTIHPVTAMDGLTIVTNAEELTESWRQLLDNDAKLRRIMKNLIKGTGWGAVISAHLLVAVPIIKNHSVGMEHLWRKKDDASNPA